MLQSSYNDKETFDKSATLFKSKINHYNEDLIRSIENDKYIFTPIKENSPQYLAKMNNLATINNLIGSDTKLEDLAPIKAIQDSITNSSPFVINEVMSAPTKDICVNNNDKQAAEFHSTANFISDSFYLTAEKENLRFSTNFNENENLRKKIIDTNDKVDHSKEKLKHFKSLNSSCDSNKKRNKISLILPSSNSKLKNSKLVKKRMSPSDIKKTKSNLRDFNKIPIYKMDSSRISKDEKKPPTTTTTAENRYMGFPKTSNNFNKLSNQTNRVTKVPERQTEENSNFSFTANSSTPTSQVREQRKLTLEKYSQVFSDVVKQPTDSSNRNVRNSSTNMLGDMTTLKNKVNGFNCSFISSNNFCLTNNELIEQFESRIIEEASKEKYN